MPEWEDTQVLPYSDPGYLVERWLAGGAGRGCLRDFSGAEGMAGEGAFGVEVVALGQRFARALYGPVDPSEPEVDALKAATKALRARRP